MYRHGLGDCFLLSFPKKDGTLFNILIDCGALNRTKEQMEALAEHIKASVTQGEKARIDLVVATHEHKDHLCGFNQARDIFDSIEIGAVWMGWTENLSEAEASALKSAKKAVLKKLHNALRSPFADSAVLTNVRGLLGFEDDELPGTGTIAEALQYLKKRGGPNTRYLSPGEGPIELPEVDDVRVYVLGPPKDPTLLKRSGVTERMKRESVIYHLARLGLDGLAALDAAVSVGTAGNDLLAERYHPFAAQHRISRNSPCFKHIEEFVSASYDAPKHDWRQIDEDWLGAFGQLALHLDNDTNNTSLVLAFEFVSTGEVLLFVGDAQVGNWQSWGTVTFKKPDGSHVAAHDLIRRTVFYKVGHHCSHNATMKSGGLELMESDKLVAFVPLDCETASMQGRKDPKTDKPKGWDMPAKPLYERLLQKTNGRVVLSDRKRKLPKDAETFGIRTDPEKTYVDYEIKPAKP